MREFDYYIFIDYFENFIGYNIIEKGKIRALLPKLSRFKHYNNAENKKLYLKNIKKTIKRENIRSYFYKIKILRTSKKMQIYLDVLEFLKKHLNCIVFISVDNNEYDNFEKLVEIVNNEKTKVVKESSLKKGTFEYQLSLIIDNLLNIERIKSK
jgi:hypothetical protein